MSPRNKPSNTSSSSARNAAPRPQRSRWDIFEHRPARSKLFETDYKCNVLELSAGLQQSGCGTLRAHPDSAAAWQNCAEAGWKKANLQLVLASLSLEDLFARPLRCPCWVPWLFERGSNWLRQKAEALVEPSFSFTSPSPASKSSPQICARRKARRAAPAHKTRDWSPATVSRPFQSLYHQLSAGAAHFCSTLLGSSADSGMHSGATNRSGRAALLKHTGSFKTLKPSGGAVSFRPITDSSQRGSQRGSDSQTVQE